MSGTDAGPLRTWTATIRWALLFGLLSGECVSSQGPVVAPEGLVSAASFSADPDRGPVVVPGRLFTIFGAQFADATQSAEQSPLPIALAGVSVTVGGIPAPLLYISPGQINFQVPFRVEGSTVPVIVNNRSGASKPIMARVAFDAPGIFTQSGGGCGHGAILNIAPDGGVTVNSPQHSASPGDYISVYGTGFGLAYFAPPDGTAASWEPLSWLSSRPFMYLGLLGTNRQGAITNYSGLAPGLIGVDQFNVLLPQNAPEGCAVPMWFGSVTANSQPVTVSIRRGGGPCSEPSRARSGALTWKRTITTGSGPLGVTKEEEIFSAAFMEGASNWLGPSAEPTVGVWSSVGARYAAPRCGVYAGANIEGGSLTIQTPTNGPMTLPFVKSLTGEYVYNKVLAKGTIVPGMLSVTSAGNPLIGQFRSTVSPPPPIEILTDLSPGKVIDITKPFTLTWRNGLPGDLVNVRLLSGFKMSALDVIYSGLGQYVPAEAGLVTLGTRELTPGRLFLPLTPSTRFSVIVSLLSRSPTRFTAQGMTFEATHEWEYEFRFLDLKLASPGAPN